MSGRGRGRGRGRAVLRIGLLHQYRLGTSGSGVYLTGLARELVALGHKVVVLSHDDDAAARLPAGCTTVCLRGAGTPVAYPRAEEPGSTLFRDLSDGALERYLEHAVSLVVDTVEREGLDVLHVNSEVPMAWVAAEAQRRCGVPYVVVGHGSTLEYVVGVDPRYRPLARRGLAEASAVVALNQDVRTRMLAVCPEVAPHLVQVPPGVDTELFVPSAPVQGPPVVACVGRLSVEKGVFHLVGTLDALQREVPGVRVVVVGGGVDREHLEAMHGALVDGDLAEAERALRRAADPSEAPWVRALVEHWARGDGPGVWPELELTGQLPPSEVSVRVAAADVLVVPSLVREAYPLVVLEALACGTPTVCADQGGLRAVLDELRPKLPGVGELLALSGDAPGLVRDLAPVVGRLLRWLDVDDRRRDARRTCRDLATSRYGWPAVALRLEQLYAGACTETLRPAQQCSC